jgi:integrase
MARSIYSNALKNRTNRLKLPIRKKPFKCTVARGVRLCYRRNASGSGSWSVETAQWLRRFALADDHEDANGQSVQSYYQASATALKMVRGSESDADKPITVSQAFDAYAVDLLARNGAKHNAISVRNHVPPALLDKVVALLTETELTAWRNGLVATKGLKPASANRYAKAFCAALALAAKRDKRIGNAAAWKNGLKPIKGGNVATRDNFYLSDAVIRAIVAESYIEDADFGALVDVMAVTGVRESQVLKLTARDIVDDKLPRLMVPCSAKGKDRTPESRALPITPRLAAMLRTRAAGRRANAPLFDRLWNTSARFRVVLHRLGLDETLTPYVLRHSSIIRQIRNNVPLRIVSFNHDTSTHEIEKTYARFLNDAADDLTRAGLLSDEAGPADNVVALRGGE